MRTDEPEVFASLQASGINRKVGVAVVLSDDEIDYFFSEGEKVFNRYSELGFVFHRYESQKLSELEFIGRNYEVIMGAWSMKRLPLEYIYPHGSIRYLCYLAGTVRRIISQEHLNAGLLVTNWGGIAASSVAECALHHILAALRQTNLHVLNMHCRSAWRTKDVYASSIIGKRVGIHGFGKIARKLTEILRTFDVEVAVCSDGPPDSLFEEHNVVRCSRLNDLFSWADIIVEAEALTPETEGCVDALHLDMLPDGGVFVNIARGRIVVEEALVNEARRGRLQFALDVHHREPLAVDHPLRGLDNVLLTPHIGGPTFEQWPSCGAAALRNLVRYSQGEPLQDLVTSESYQYST